MLVAAFVVMGSLVTPMAFAAPGDFSWTQVTDPTVASDDWEAIAMSSDGTRLVATVYNGYVYTSSDSGVSWTQRTSAGARTWRSVAISDDGLKMAAVGGGYVYLSTDAGASWSETTGQGSDSVEMSADGTTILTNYDISTDSGATWIPLAAPCNGYVAMSDNGRTLAISSSNSVCISTDAGATWTQHFDTGSGRIAMSADGTKIIAASSSDYVYLSSDSGMTWTQQTAFGTGSWESVAISDDGKTLMVGEDWGPLWLSRDSGLTWVEQTELGEVYWYAIDIAGDGKKMVAAGGHRYPIYIGTVEGPATAKIDLSTLPAASKTATEVAIANASVHATSEICYNFESGSVVTLSGAGANAPTSGVAILGGVAFTLTCTAPGGASDVELALGASYANTSELRAYKTSRVDSKLYDITSQVTFTNKLVDGTMKTVASYNLVDGGEFDEDAAANGTIVDPVYIGVVAGASTTTTDPATVGGTLANTGTNTIATMAGALLMIVTSIVISLKSLKGTKRMGRI